MISNILTVLSFVVLLLSSIIDCNFLSDYSGFRANNKYFHPLRQFCLGGIFFTNNSQKSIALPSGQCFIMDCVRRWCSGIQS